MGLVIPVGFAQLTLGGEIAFDPEEAVITLGLEISANPTPTMAEDCYDVWSGALDSLSSTDWLFKSATIKAGPTSTGPTADFTDGVVTGTQAFSTVPINTAILVRKQTALGGRKGRGRMYTCGQLFVGDVGGAGIIASSHVSDLDTAWFSILGGLQSVVGVTDVVLLHSDSTAPTPITGFSVQSKAATQRRRLRP
jgi:hypothetical protein